MFDLEQYYRVYATVNLDSIYSNMKNMKEHINDVLKVNSYGEKARMVAVIKADGYGHGAVPVAVTVDELVEAYAVATIEEALILRKHGIKKPIYLLGFIPNGKIALAIENEIRFAVYKKGQAEQISREAVRLGKTGYIHIKLDTGMGRIGFLPTEESISDIVYINSLENIKLEGIFTHFAKADESDKEATKKQFRIFSSFVLKLEENGVNIEIGHCANSAGIIDIPYTNVGESRAGIALYGMYPSDEVDKAAVKLYPALELKSHIIYIKKVEKGTPIGYGGTFVTDRTTLVATIPVGYGDGYPRNLSNKGSVLINGKRVPIIGRVCMDQFMADVTDLDIVSEGDEVTLVGRDGDEVITVEEVAALAGTFNYEFVCDLGKRIPRVYLRNGKIAGTKDYFDDEYNFRLGE